MPKIKLPQKVVVRTHLANYPVQITDDKKEWWNCYLILHEGNLSALFSQKSLPLGESNYIIEKGEMPYSYVSKESVYLDLEKDKLYEKLWKDVFKEIWNYYQKANAEEKRTIEVSVDNIAGDNIEDKLKIKACNKLWESINKFVITTAITEEDAANLTTEKRMQYLSTYIQGGWEIDSILKMLVRSGLVRFDITDNFTQYAKYRGHALVIKNTKTGMTSVCSRIGLNISTASFSSLEGFAENKYGTRHSILHEQTGLVNFDEFLLMKDNMVLKMYNFLEQGIYITGKNAQIIENKSCAMCIFTANPTDFESAENPDELVSNSISPQVLASTFRSAIGKLSSTSRAMGSRFGLAVFSPDMQPAKKVQPLSQKEIDEAKCIIDSLVYFSMPKIKAIFDNPDVQKWLDTPLVEYKNSVERVAFHIADGAVRQFWLGQAEAYRHIRGLALSESIVDNVIIGNNTDVAAIIADADDSLTYICNINLTSLKRLHEVEKTAPISRIEIESFSPTYIKPLLHTMVYMKLATPDKTEFSITELMNNYTHLISEDMRKQLYGVYFYTSTIKQKKNNERIKRALENYFKIVDINNDLNIIFNEENKNYNALIEYFTHI